jgi:hypothetical protein
MSNLSRKNCINMHKTGVNNPDYCMLFAILSVANLAQAVFVNLNKLKSTTS